MDARNRARDLVFLSSCVGPGALRVQSMRGREAISELYEFELWLESTQVCPLPRDTARELLSSTAGIAFGVECEFPIFGVLRELEVVPSEDEWAPLYRAVLVPRLWYTTQTYRSRVYQGLSVPEIVSEALGEAGMQEGKHFELRLAYSYPPREYVVQYEETSFQFCCRLLEHEGICFYFEQTLDGDKVIFADDRTGFRQPEGHEQIPYQPRGGVTGPCESVWSVSYRTQVLPQQLFVKDYNWRTPGLALLEQTAVDAEGFGQQVLHGEHFLEPPEGKRLARIRTEQLVAHSEVYTGSGSVRDLRSGQLFTLRGHPLQGFDQQYLVTEVRHQAEQEQTCRESGGPQGNRGYSNTWVAIAAAVPFRPERRTPKPKVHGVAIGTVAGRDDGVSAPLDEKGRYQVVLPFDSSGKPTPRIRMMQVSSGAGYGMHLPLHVGTEVAVAHINGDPDRPLILGAVPNTRTPSPVVDSNATQSIIESRAGICIEFEDYAATSGGDGNGPAAGQE